ANARVADVTGHGNTAYLGANPAAQPARVATDGANPLGGQAVHFDGVNDFVEVPTSSALHSDQGVTVSGWVKADNLNSDWQIIFYKGNTPDWQGNGSPREYAMWLNRAGFLSFASTPADRVSVGQLATDTAAGSVQPGQWYHFAAVVSSDPNSP